MINFKKETEKLKAKKEQASFPRTITPDNVEKVLDEIMMGKKNGSSGVHEDRPADGHEPSKAGESMGRLED